MNTNVNAVLVAVVEPEQAIDPLDVLQYYGLNVRADLFITCPHRRFVWYYLDTGLYEVKRENEAP